MCVNPALMDPPGLNPHCGISKVRTRDQALAGAPHVWQCNYCPAKGTMAELAKVACTHVYPPCEYCGQTPECARDCDGVARALSDKGVYVTAGPARGDA